jgi:hypothetical protein
MGNYIDVAQRVDGHMYFDSTVNSVPKEIEFIRGAETIIGFFIGMTTFSLAHVLYLRGVSLLRSNPYEFYPALQECCKTYIEWLEEI